MRGVFNFAWLFLICTVVVFVAAALLAPVAGTALAASARPAGGAYALAGRQAPARALAARRALVRKDTMPGTDRAAAEKAAARLRSQPGKQPLARKNAAASSQVSAYLDYALLSGPGNGAIISCNGAVCAQPGDVSAGEPLSIWEEIGVTGTGSYQVTFSWTEWCGGTNTKTFGSQTVTVGPSLWYPASGTAFTVTASCPGAAAASLPNYDLTIKMSVAGGPAPARRSTPTGSASPAARSWPARGHPTARAPPVPRDPAAIRSTPPRAPSPTHSRTPA